MVVLKGTCEEGTIGNTFPQQGIPANGHFGYTYSERLPHEVGFSLLYRDCRYYPRIMEKQKEKNIEHGMATCVMSWVLGIKGMS